jgi:hypothetical protein
LAEIQNSKFLFNSANANMIGELIVPLLNNCILDSADRKLMLVKGNFIDLLACILHSNRLNQICRYNISLFVGNLLNGNKVIASKLIHQHRSQKCASILHFYLMDFESNHFASYPSQNILSYFVAEKEHRAFLYKNGVLMYVCGIFPNSLRSKNCQSLSQILDFLCLICKYHDGQQQLLQIEGIQDYLTSTLEVADSVSEKTILLATLLVQLRESKIIFLSNGIPF